MVTTLLSTFPYHIHVYPLPSIPYCTSHTHHPLLLTPYPLLLSLAIAPYQKPFTKERATPIISLCHSIFTDRSILRLLSPQNWSVPVYMSPHRYYVDIIKHANFLSIFLLIGPVVVGICSKFKLKIDQSVKTPSQVYGVVALQVMGSCPYPTSA